MATGLQIRVNGFIFLIYSGLKHSLIVIPCPLSLYYSFTHHTHTDSTLSHTATP